MPPRLSRSSPPGSRSLHEGGKQALRRLILYKQPLGVPLHTDDEGLAGDFHRFNDPITGAGADHHPLAWHLHGLMMQAIDAHLLQAENGGEACIRDKIDAVRSRGSP